MRTSPKRTLQSLCFAVGAAFAANAANAQTPGRIDRSFEPAPTSCAEVRWSASVLSKYPNISDACQSIQMRDGKSFAMLEGTVDDIANDGRKITVDFEDGGELTLAPTTSTTLYVEGEETSFANLREGQELNFYIPEDRFQAEFPGANGSAPHVIVPILVVKPATTASADASGTVADAAPIGTLVLIPATQQAVANDATSDGCWATVYGKSNFKGDSLTLIGPLEMERMVGPFGFDWDEKLNSIKAGPRATVTLYDDESYRDSSAEIQPGKSVAEISERMGLFEDVESMRVRCG